MVTKNKSFIGVTLGENSIDLVCLKKSGASFKVTGVHSCNAAGVSDEDRVKMIQNAAKGFGARSAGVACVLPNHIVTTKNIEIPSVDEAEIKSIVNLQAGRHTPFSREEIEIGYINIGIYKTTYTKVLLAIANKSVIKNQIELIEKAGLRVSSILFAPESVGVFYEKDAAEQGADKPVGIIDIGENAADFHVVLKGKTIATRSIPFGKKQIEEEGEIAKETFVEELRQTFEAYQTEDVEQVPAKFLLATDDEVSKSIQGMLSEKLKWNVEICSYVDRCQTSHGVLKKLASDFPRVSFLNLIASLLNISKAQIDLFPKEVKLQKSIETQGREFVKTTILFFILLIVILGFLSLRMLFFSAYLQGIRKDYAAQRQEVARLLKMDQRVGLVQAFFDKRMEVLDRFNLLYDYVTTDIYLSSIDIAEDGSLLIQGVTDSSSNVYNFVTMLKESGDFETVDLKSTTSKKDRGKDVAAFEISLK